MASAIPRRIAVVTGANQGIGKEIARGLARIPGLHVIGTSRREDAGAEAEAELRKDVSISQSVGSGSGSSGGTDGTTPLPLTSSSSSSFLEFYSPLDIADASTIQAFANFIQEKRGGKIHILVNNAGMAYKGDTFGADEAQLTINTNVIGTLNITEALLPFLLQAAKEEAVATQEVFGASAAGKVGLQMALGVGSVSSSSSTTSTTSTTTTHHLPNPPRIINVCSQAGRLAQFTLPALQSRFQDTQATKASVVRLRDEFISSIRDNTYQAKGWPKSMYGVSKALEIMWTQLLAKELEKDGIVVNALCPGYCSTSMSSFKGPRSAAQGAETPIWLATRRGNVNELTGGFYLDKQLISW